MVYVVTNTAGNAVAVVNDGTVNSTSTSLNLVGIDFADYSKKIADNFVGLLENFANNVPPRTPITGQLWYNTTSKTLQIFNGVIFNTVNIVKASPNAPTSTQVGDLWYNTKESQLFFWNGGEWIVIAPTYSSDQGKSGTVTVTTQDTAGFWHTVLQIWLNNVLLGVFNTDGPFEPMPGMPGFIVIEHGFNLLQDQVINGTITNSNAASSLTTGAAGQFLSASGESVHTGSITVNELTVGSGSLALLVSTDNTIRLAGNSNIEIATPNDINLNAASVVTNNLSAATVTTMSVTSPSYKFCPNSSINSTISNNSVQTVSFTINDADALTINSVGTITVTGSINIVGNLNCTGGGVFSNPVKTSYTPNEPNDVINKAYVDSSMPNGAIIQYYGDIMNIPPRWALCDGGNGTPDLRNSFVIGAGGNYTMGQSSGSNLVAVNTTSSGVHSHYGNTTVSGSHMHTGSTFPTVLTSDDLPEHVHMYLNTVSLIPKTTDLTSYFTYPYQPDLNIISYPGVEEKTQTTQLPGFNYKSLNSLYQNNLYDAAGTRVRFWGNPSALTYFGNGYPVESYPYNWSSYPSDWEDNSPAAISVTGSTYPSGNAASTGHTHFIMQDGDHIHNVTTSSDGLHNHMISFDNKPQCIALAFIMKIS
jgi:hypothetical protein